MASPSRFLGIWRIAVCMALVLFVAGCVTQGGTAPPVVKITGKPYYEVYSFNPAEQYAYANAAFAFAHEIGHMVVQDYGVPVIGSEEIAVDNAGFLFLTTLNTQNGLLSANVIWNVARHWKVTAQFTKIELEDMQAYWDEHGFPHQRYFNLLCQLAGQNTTHTDRRESDEPPEVQSLSKRQRQVCREDFLHIRKSWRNAKNRQVKGRNLNGTLRHVVFDTDPKGEPGRLRYGFYEDILSDVLERVRVAGVGFDDFNVVFLTCNRANAFWLKEKRAIVMCYELIDEYAMVGKILHERGLLENEEKQAFN